MPGKQLADPCLDCREAEAIFTIRTRRLCRDCYVRFVGYKVFKRTERYRLRRDLPKTGPCRLLLPLSYGLSSSVLLHIVHNQIKKELAKPHALPGFDLHVLIIEPSSVSSSNPSHDKEFELVQRRYPLASFTRLLLEDIFEFDLNLQDVLSQFSGSNFIDNVSLSKKERLDSFRASITSATSRVDIDYILINRLVVSFAKKMECLGVLWGDSDSRLAAKALANVAKGRGSSLTWQVSDGMSPFGLEFNFPLRDLYAIEIQNYSSLFTDLVDTIIPDVQISENTLTKNLSIDELMIRYVQTQGEKYPGVMSNVTRTANKLQSSQIVTDGSQCALCGTYMSAPERHSGDLGAADGSSGYSLHRFCYACARSRPEFNC